MHGVYESRMAETLISLLAIGQEHQLPEKKKHFDSNCITPGTPFMAHLATCLRYHVAAKQNSDPLWKDVSKRAFWNVYMILMGYMIAQGDFVRCYCTW